MLSSKYTKNNTPINCIFLFDCGIDMDHRTLLACGIIYDDDNDDGALVLFCVEHVYGKRRRRKKKHFI